MAKRFTNGMIPIVWRDQLIAVATKGAFRLLHAALPTKTAESELRNPR